MMVVLAVGDDIQFVKQGVGGSIGTCPAAGASRSFYGDVVAAASVEACRPLAKHRVIEEGRRNRSSSKIRQGGGPFRNASRSTSSSLSGVSAGMGAKNRIRSCPWLSWRTRRACQGQRAAGRRR